MGRAPCCSKVGLHRGPWTAREDSLLTKYIQVHGEGNWRSLPKKAGLLRCGKSCRLRWMNYLRPDIKRGNITPDEDDLIIKMHALLGNRWSLIAGRLPGRTDNEIKNYWNTHLSKRLKSQGTDPLTHKKLSDPTCIQQQPKKRRSSSNSNRSKQKNKSKASNAAVDQTHHEKMKAHNPKPIRIRSLSSFSKSRNSSFDWTTTTTTTTTIASGYSSSHEREGGPLLGTEIVDDDDLPWSNFNVDVDDERGNEAGFLIGIGGDDQGNHDDLVNGSDFECQSHAPMPDNSLEKLYDEYLQLLKKTEDEQVQLDSFAESLFI